MFRFLQNRTLFLQIRRYTDVIDYRIYRNRLITEKYKKELNVKKEKQSSTGVFCRPICQFETYHDSCPLGCLDQPINAVKSKI